MINNIKISYFRFYYQNYNYQIIFYSKNIEKKDIIYLFVNIRIILKYLKDIWDNGIKKLIHQ